MIRPQQQLQQQLPFNNYNMEDSSNYLAKMVGMKGLQIIAEERLEKEGILDAEEVKANPRLVFEHIPVSTKVFMKDWLHEENYPLQQKLVDKMLGVDPLVWDNTYEEAVLPWGMGAGKDNTVAKMFIYILYWMLCLRNPQAYFGQGKGSELALGNTCISGTEAKRIFFKKVKNFIKQITDPSTGKNWFEDKMNMDLRDGSKHMQDRQINTPKNVVLYSLDSQTQTGVGKDMLVMVYDEIAGFRYQDAEDLVDIATKTQLSRFPKQCKRFFISFKRDDNDFQMIRYNQMKKNKIGPCGRKVWCKRAATWEVNLARTKEDFAEEYRRDPEGARRTYECKGKTREGGYFKIPEVIRRNVNRYRSNPVADGKQRIFNIKKLKFKSWFRGVKGVDYFGHADLAKGKRGGDAAGFCICHGVENMKVRYDDKLLKYLQKEGMPTSTMEQISGKGVFVDLMLQFKAQPSREVMFDDVVSLIVFLHNELGFTIRDFSYDGFQSTDSIQKLKWNHGIGARLLSVERGKMKMNKSAKKMLAKSAGGGINQAYDITKGLMYRGLLDYYYHMIFLREAEELIINDSGKVDHPERSFRRDREEGDFKGSHDIFQSVAANCWKIMADSQAKLESWFADTTSIQVDTLGKPDEVEKERQKRMTLKAQLNADKLARQDENELVAYGEQPVGDY